MDKDGKVVRLRQPAEIDDPLAALLHTGVRRLLEQTIEAEVYAFLMLMKDLTGRGKRLCTVVRS